MKNFRQSKRARNVFLSDRKLWNDGAAGQIVADIFGFYYRTCVCIGYVEFPTCFGTLSVRVCERARWMNRPRNIYRFRNKRGRLRAPLYCCHAIRRKGTGNGVFNWRNPTLMNDKTVMRGAIGWKLFSGKVGGSGKGEIFLGSNVRALRSLKASLTPG